MEEDRLAKPHRPLPSGRISLERAWVLYVMLFALMWAVSVHARTVKCTFAYTVAIVAYNEGGLAKVPIVKNVIGAIGLACYCWGATVILGMSLMMQRVLNRSSEADRTSRPWERAWWPEGNCRNDDGCNFCHNRRYSL